MHASRDEIKHGGLDVTESGSCSQAEATAERVICKLSERHSWPPLSLKFLAALAIINGTTCISRDSPNRFALDISVHSREPTVHLVRQKAFATLVYMFCPLCASFWGGLNVGPAVVLTTLQQFHNGLNSIFDTARNVSEWLMRTKHHEHVGHIFGEDAHASTWPVIRPNCVLASGCAAISQKPRRYAYVER